MSINSNNNTSIIGSNMLINNNLDIQTENDLLISSIADTYYYENKTKDKGTFSSKETHMINQIQEQLQSNLIVGNNVNINSNKDTYILGSNVNVINDLNITAENVNIMNTYDTEYNFYEEKKKGFSGIDLSIFEGDKILRIEASYDINKKTNSSLENIVVGSSIISNNNLNIKSNNNTNIIGSNIISNNDIKINTNNNLNILSAENKYSNEYKEVDNIINIGHSINNNIINSVNNTKNTINDYSNTTEGLISAVLNTLSDGFNIFQSIGSIGFNVSSNKDNILTITNSEIDQISNIQSNILSNNNIDLISNNKDINIKGANIQAENDINIIANNGNTTIESVQDIYKNISNTNYYGIGVNNISIGNNSSHEYISNNIYTNITSNNKDVNIFTNNLILTEINKDNLNINNVNGNIIENSLKEYKINKTSGHGIGINLATSGISINYSDSEKGWGVNIDINIGELVKIFDNGIGKYTKEQVNELNNNLNKIKEISTNIHDKIKNIFNDKDKTIEEKLNEVKNVIENKIEENTKKLEENNTTEEEKEKIQEENNKLEEIKKNLGELSSAFESNNNSQAIGRESNGTYSYGTYQINSKNMENFIELLASENKELSKKLKTAAGKNKDYNSEEFKNIWKEVSKTEGFNNIEHKFIYKTHYKPVADGFTNITGLNLDSYSDTLKQVLWSQSVQHGDKGNFQMIDNLKKNNKDLNNMSEENIITKLYEERVNYLWYLVEKGKFKLEDIPSQEKRYQKELAKALNDLNNLNNINNN